MADAKKHSGEGSEFADFMADISQEIAQRVGSLQPAPASPPPAPEKKATPPSPPTPPPSPEDGLILDWESVTDRMIEEML